MGEILLMVLSKGSGNNVILLKTLLTGKDSKDAKMMILL